MDVSVLIVTYNSAHTISECVASALRQTACSNEVIVVDNASADGTVEKLRSRFPNIHLIANAENVGFGRANNHAARQCRGDYLYLLNPDACLNECDALTRMAACMRSHNRWGLAGTKVISSEGVNEAPPAFAYPDQHRVSHNFQQLPGSIAWVIGASMFIQREAFERIGGFDEEFFLHSEETDLCLRMRQAGYEIGYTEDVVVTHIGGVSEKSADTYTAWTRRLNGLHRFWCKHYRQHDVLRLARRNLVRSHYRLLWYRLLGSISNQPTLQEKAARYKATRDVTKELLKRFQPGVE